jgi:dihydroneopterin aldolase
MTLRAEDVPWSWDVTSDSLAAWLAGRIGAGSVLLVKQVEPPASPVSAEVLAAQGIVDAAFPRLMGTVRVYLAGPADHAMLAAAVRGGAIAGARIVSACSGEVDAGSPTRTCANKESCSGEVDARSPTTTCATR